MSCYTLISQPADLVILKTLITGECELLAAHSNQ